VDLLFSDVVMPGTIDGIDLAQQALCLQSTMKVLLTSGFPGTRGAGQSAAGCAFPLLSKPHRYDELARTVRAVLDKDKEPPPAASLATAADQTLHDGNPAVAAKRV
jgi:DNA-binding NtrC family response regulator